MLFNFEILLILSILVIKSFFFEKASFPPNVCLAFFLLFFVMFCSVKSCLKGVPSSFILFWTLEYTNSFFSKYNINNLYKTYNSEEVLKFKIFLFFIFGSDILILNLSILIIFSSAILIFKLSFIKFILLKSSLILSISSISSSNFKSFNICFCCREYLYVLSIRKCLW